MTTTPGTTVPHFRALPMPSASSDFDFLEGSFDVTNRRLRHPLTGSDDWEEFPATAVARTHFAGGVSIDEMFFPTTQTYGMSLRVFDVEAEEWSIYWVSSRDGRLSPPVRGRWDNGSCWLVGEDVHDGRPVLASYAWSDVTGTGAHWQQAFSVDDGKTWEVNWEMNWVRRTDRPDHTQTGKITSDFDFVNGDWQVDHRRLAKPLLGSDEWSSFSTPWTAYTLFHGAVTVDEIGLADGVSRGLTVRLFDPSTREWSIYWVNSAAGRMDTPVVGSFSDGVGIFAADEVYDGQPIRCRFVWSDITETTTHWQQDFSTDGGATWETNWVMDSTRLNDSGG